MIMSGASTTFSARISGPADLKTWKEFLNKGRHCDTKRQGYKDLHKKNDFSANTLFIIFLIFNFNFF